jgi:hypothetical protein
MVFIRACSGLYPGGVFKGGAEQNILGVPMRFARFLQRTFVLALVMIASPAWPLGPGGGHGGHGGGHAGHFGGGFGGGHGHGFHSGRGHHFFHGGVVFLGAVEPFGFDPEPVVAPPPPVAPLDCGGGVGCGFVPPGMGGLLQSGPSLPEEPLAAKGEIDLTRAHWREPDPGECPPDQKLFRPPGQRKWKCADPRLQRADGFEITP